MADPPKKPISLRLAIDNGEEAKPLDPAAAAPVAKPAASAKPAHPGNGTKQPARRSGGGIVGAPPDWSQRLPDDCPVTPLGRDGLRYFYLDAAQHLVELTATDHQRLNLMGLFGQRTDYLYKQWPRLTNIAKREHRTDPEPPPEWDITGWKPEAVAESLMAACARLGDWDSFKRVRGPGAWRADDGRLILHCGDVVLVEGMENPTGFIAGYVYPTRAGLPRPWPHRAAAADAGPGYLLRDLFATWNWQRGRLDVLLLLGLIGCGFLGGALAWRPMGWITGGSGTGKSTLKRMLEGLYAGRLIGTEDPSPAGIWQKLGHATLPVAVDEHEPEEDNRKNNAVVKLARMAASGALMLRGGADHQGTEFVVRSVFMFLSILVPPLMGQDRNRMAILSLGPLKSESAPELPESKLRELGQQVLRRLIDHWPEWNEVHGIFRAALLNEHLSARTSDVYAALLTAAELIQHDDRTALRDYAEQIAFEIARYAAGEAGDDMPDEERCLAYLQTAIVPLETTGPRKAVGEWIRRATIYPTHDERAIEARKVLANYGLKITYIRHEGGARINSLGVAFSHKELSRVFAGTHWAARAGTNGVWKQALERLPGTERAKSPLWFSGGNARALLIPFTTLFPPDGDPGRAQSESELDAELEAESEP